jgi:hypothetical protein
LTELRQDPRFATIAVGIQREPLRRAHQRAADARKNCLHHVSKWLVGGYDLIAYEALKVKGLAQGNLAKSIIGRTNHWPNQSLVKNHGCRVGNPAVPATLQG